MPAGSLSICAHLRAALATGLLTPLLELDLLAPSVSLQAVPQGPEHPCSRAQALAWLGRVHEEGLRAHPEEAVVHPGAVALGLVRPTPRSGRTPQFRYAVFHLRHSRITRIRTYTSRDAALRDALPPAAAT